MAMRRVVQIMANKLNKKGFTLMELLVTVILVAILASYGVYYYSDILREGRYNAARGKLAALGGATARFILEHAGDGVTCEGYSINNFSSATLPGSCDAAADRQFYMYNVFRCDYADKNLAIAEGYSFSFGCPNEHSCGTYSSMTVYMKPGAGNHEDNIVPACAYFDPDTDRIVEVRSGN